MIGGIVDAATLVNNTPDSLLTHAIHSKLGQHTFPTLYHTLQTNETYTQLYNNAVQMCAALPPHSHYRAELIKLLSPHIDIQHAMRIFHMYQHHTYTNAELFRHIHCPIA